MVRACGHPGDFNYRTVGARGIGMNRRWKASYQNFLEDMGECPPGHKLAREDEDGDFTPSNCYWAPEYEDELYDAA